MREAIKEVLVLLNRGTFKIILRKDFPSDSIILPGRFVHSITFTEDGEVKFKAQFVIGGHRGKLKYMIVHSSTTPQMQSIRPLIALVVVNGFNIWTSDVTQENLQ